METLKAIFVKPDPHAQVRKCNALIRSNVRKLDRDITSTKQVEVKTKNLILAADRRGQREPARRAQAEKEVRGLARELIRTRRQSSRLVTAKAQLNSVQMQVNEAFAVRKIEGSIRASVGIMRDVNTLVRLPALAQTMQELSVELTKAGIMEEMVGDLLPETDMLEEEGDEAEGEVERVLGEILKDRMEKTGAVPSVPVQNEHPQVPNQQVPAQQVPVPAQQEAEDEEDTEAMMDQMRNRLEALRS